MKVVYQHLASTALPLLGLLVAHNTPLGAEAASDIMTVGASGVSFSLERYDDGRETPYTVTFTEDSTQSTYTFSTAGFVTDIVVGSEEYEVLYESDGEDLSEVRLTSSGRRGLLVPDAEGQEQEAGGGGGGGGGGGSGGGMLVGGGGQSGLGSSTNQRRRRLYACDDCVETWDAVCDDGVPSVCELVDYGSPISPAAEASITTMCDVMGRACSKSGGTETCAGQCGDDDDGDDGGDDKVLNSCLDSTSDNYQCSFEGTTDMDFTSCAFVDADTEDIPACFDSFGRENIERLWLSFHDGLTTLPVGLFTGLSSVVDMDLSYNALVSLPVGAFSGLTSVIKLEIHYSKLESLPEGLFSEMTNLENLIISSSHLTSLPAEIFSPLTKLQSLDLRTSYSVLQCVPFTSATTILVDSDDILQGTCECEPAEAITCATGTCQPGASGYTCE